MKIETKYDVGQTVWVRAAKSLKRVETIKCSACDGEGEIPLKNEKMCICPVCKGIKTVQITKWDTKATTGEIRSIVVTKQVRDENVFELSPEASILYDIPSPLHSIPNQGSKSVFALNIVPQPQENRGVPEHLVFATEEECLKAIKESKK